MFRRGSVYDISPRTRAEMLALIDEAGLRATDVTIDALRVASDLEPGIVGRVAGRVPDGVLGASRRDPTMVFLLEG